MQKARSTLLLPVVIILCMASLIAQQHASPTPSPMVLTGVIPLPNVQGRIDHLSLDPKGRLFISALGNNSEEVIDLSASVRSHSITGIPKPQGVVYCADGNKLFVGSDEGKLYIYDATSFALITTIDFGDDVDNLRYDASSKSVYVGYGDEQTGAIAAVDVTTNKRLPTEFKLGAHPESFQLETSGPNNNVNLPDLKQIAAIDRKTGHIARWPVAFDSNFPMALDEADHRLFVATRAPARMAVFDTMSGRMVLALPCVQGSDDLFFDAARKRVYVTGGEGFISVYQQKDPDHYELLTQVPTAIGARTAGYFGKGRKGFDLLYVAVPVRTIAAAEVLVYTLQD
jgi:DNA-binding beta-propeller fold protein YncE